MRKKGKLIEIVGEDSMQLLPFHAQYWEYELRIIEHEKEIKPVKRRNSSFNKNISRMIDYERK